MLMAEIGTGGSKQGGSVESIDRTCGEHGLMAVRRRAWHGRDEVERPVRRRRGLVRDHAAGFRSADGVEISMVRKSTGEILDQIRAERAHPTVDVWWGGTGDTHLQAGSEGLLEEYQPAHQQDLLPWAQNFNAMSGSKSAGIYAGALGFAYNSELLARTICRPRHAGRIWRRRFIAAISRPATRTIRARPSPCLPRLSSSLARRRLSVSWASLTRMW